jgi:hypothetical protein
MVQSLGNIASGNSAIWYAPLGTRRLSYVPQALTELNGFGSGIVEIPRHLYPAVQRRVDVADEQAALPMYANVIENATGSQHMTYLNRYLLVRYWSRLRLSPATRDRWEERFPVLR